MSTKTCGSILIVDDSLTNVEILAAILEKEHQVYFATDGPTALEILERESVDLLLLDIMMPGMDGYEVCSRVKCTPGLESIPVIFITAMNEVDDEARGFELGAVDYITKPVSPPIVKARVRTHLELKAQRDRLQHLSTIDGLTGIPNRRRFDEVLQQEWRRAIRHCSTLALLLIDIDLFKRFNDEYGHVAGDDCLRLVARTMFKGLHRSGDFLARYGGEEFAAILPEAKLEGAVAIAEEFRERLSGAQLDIPGVEWPRPVTLSIGAGVVAPEKGASPQSFIEQVDGLLYRAKAEGRDRVVGQRFSMRQELAGGARR